MIFNLSWTVNALFCFIINVILLLSYYFIVPLSNSRNDISCASCSRCRIPLTPSTCQSPQVIKIRQAKVMIMDNSLQKPLSSNKKKPRDTYKRWIFPSIVKTYICIFWIYTCIFIFNNKNLYFDLNFSFLHRKNITYVFLLDFFCKTSSQSSSVRYVMPCFCLDYLMSF